MLIHLFFEDTWMGEIKLEDKGRMNQMEDSYLLLLCIVWLQEYKLQRMQRRGKKLTLNLLAS